MLRNYIIIAMRSLLRNRVYSTINISGLTLGIACSFLIALFLREEWTFDTFHKNAGSIYRAYVKEDYGENEKFFNTVTPFPLGPALKENFEEVQHAVRVTRINSQLKVSGQQFTESVTITDAGFFTVFDFPISEGESSQILRHANNIVLTRAAAMKYFGKIDVINEVVSLQLGETFEDFRVAAITEDVPGNSSITFNCIISSLNLPKLYHEQTLTSAWFNVTPETYIQLNPDADAKALMSKFPALFKSILGDEYETSKYFVGLQPLLDIHLNTDFPKGAAPVSNPKYGYILAGVAILVLFLACINFITLSIGRTLKRAKEVGIRKVVGAVRSQLIAQFIGEAVLTTFVSLVRCSLLLLHLLLFWSLGCSREVTRRSFFLPSDQSPF
jgi:putative ABC transport system permease protein